MGEALEVLRRFNYERIYLRPASVEQSAAVVELLRALVDHYVSHPTALPARRRARARRPGHGSGRGRIRERDDRPFRLHESR